MQRRKYNRTHHLPWSPGLQNDDRVMTSIAGLIGVPLVITEKMDGGNYCMQHDASYPRSPNHSGAGWWYDMVKAEHGRVKWQIEPDIAIFGENVQAVHSIVYEGGLPGPYLVFGVLDLAENVWWGWEYVKFQAEVLGLPTVPELWRGVVRSREALKEITEDLATRASEHGSVREGLVVRRQAAIPDDQFHLQVGKWVRRGHVQTDQHWTRTAVPQPCFRKTGA